jgi:FAD/FMN-containing dehydrogenase
MKQDRVSDPQLARLEQLLDAARITTDSTSLAAYEIDGMLPGAVVRAADAREVAEIVRFAGASSG